MDPDQKALIEQIIDARVTLHLARTRLQDQQAAPHGAEKLTATDRATLAADIRAELEQLKIAPQTSGITIAGSWPSFTVAIDPAAILPAEDPFEETGSGLPEGAEGDILYHNATEWIAVASPKPDPATGEIAVLTHDGTVPSWQILEVKELDICEDGSPVAKEFFIRTPA